MLFSEWLLFFHLKSNQDLMFGTNPERVFHSWNLLFPEIWNIVCGFCVCILKCFKKKKKFYKEGEIFKYSYLEWLQLTWFFFFFTIENSTFSISQIKKKF